MQQRFRFDLKYFNFVNEATYSIFLYTPFFLSLRFSPCKFCINKMKHFEHQVIWIGKSKTSNCLLMETLCVGNESTHLWSRIEKIKRRWLNFVTAVKTIDKRFQNEFFWIKKKNSFKMKEWHFLKNWLDIKLALNILTKMRSKKKLF